MAAEKLRVWRERRKDGKRLTLKRSEGCPEDRIEKRLAARQERIDKMLEDVVAVRRGLEPPQ